MTTPRFEVVEAKPWHCGVMSRRLRAQHKALAIQFGGDVHRSLRAVYDQSPGFRRAWMIDGQLAGLGGVTDSLLSADGFIWLAFSDAAMKYPVSMLREARRQLSELMQTKRALHTAILRGDAPSKCFADHLGFETRNADDKVFLMTLKRRE